MSTFSAFEPETPRPAPDVLTLPPSAFVPSWERAPREAVRVGLTLLADSDLERAKSAAARGAWQLFPLERDAAERMETMNDLLMRWMVARGTCDPDDATKPFRLWAEAPEDIVKDALSVEGVRALYDGIERLAISTSPVQREATDEDIDELWMMAATALASMPKAKAARVRRLLAFCLDEIAPHFNEPAPEARE